MVMPDVFELPHHRRIAQILCALDGDLLRRHECFFGGGTAMTLKHHEYRKSLDIDFLCCNLVHYRELRQWLTGPEGLLVLARPGGLGFESRRDVRADAYGIRSVVAVDEVPIKFELVFEGRITFDPPGAADQVCGISCLSAADLVASKLLANSDRYADGSVFNRDALDLAMMSPDSRTFHAGFAKASSAYKSEVIKRDLTWALSALLEREGWLKRCIQALDMKPPPAVVWKRLQSLKNLLQQAA
jgi:hypothetical protein